MKFRSSLGDLLESKPTAYIRTSCIPNRRVFQTVVGTFGHTGKTQGEIILFHLSYSAYQIQTREPLNRKTQNRKTQDQKTQLDDARPEISRLEDSTDSDSEDIQSESD